jgi:hypothetical protein
MGETNSIAHEFAKKGDIWRSERKTHLPRQFHARFDSIVGVDVHGKINVAVCFEPVSADDYNQERKKFITLPNGFRALADGSISKGVKAVIMGSADVRWKSLHRDSLRSAWRSSWSTPGTPRISPCRKTGISDSLWLVQLGCFRLLKTSLIPQPRFEKASGISRFNQKPMKDLARAKNRVTKRFAWYGVRLDIAAIDFFGQFAKAELDVIVDREIPDVAVKSVNIWLKAKPESARALSTGPDDRGRDSETPRQDGRGEGAERMPQGRPRAGRYVVLAWIFGDMLVLSVVFFVPC